MATGWTTGCFIRPCFTCTVIKGHPVNKTLPCSSVQRKWLLSSIAPPAAAAAPRLDGPSIVGWFVQQNTEHKKETVSPGPVWRWWWRLASSSSNGHFVSTSLQYLVICNWLRFAERNCSNWKTEEQFSSDPSTLKLHLFCCCCCPRMVPSPLDINPHSIAPVLTFLLGFNKSKPLHTVTSGTRETREKQFVNVSTRLLSFSSSVPVEEDIL